ncbi:MAG: recombinase family protein [Pedosphaera sp.]|nr:recombinase family protein [Pedosphaera sp.]
MRTAYSYVRLSSKRQTKDTSTGQTRQLERAAAICKEKGWHLSPKTFLDLGVSGYKGENRLQGSLAKFIKLAKEGKLGEQPVLLLEGFDRFSRQNIDKAEPAFVDLLKSGVDIHVSLTNKTFTKEHTKELLSRVEILVSIKQAHDFSALLSSRIKSTQELRDRKIRSGQVIRTCNVPRYYAFDDAAKTYIQTPAADIVKRIIKDYLDGNSLYRISQTLNTEQIPCIGYKARVKWSRMTIRGILQTEALYGIHKGNEAFFKDPICDKDTFDRIRVLLKQNSGNRGRFGSDFVNMFRGIAKCPVCKGSMSAGVQFINSKTGKAKKEPYRYFRCSSVSNSIPCTNRHNFNLKEIETEFFAVFMQQDPEAVFRQNDDGANQKEITRTQTELDKVSKKIKTLLEDDDLSEVKAKLQELRKQRQSLNTKLQGLQLNRSAQVVRMENIVDFKRLLAAVKKPTETFTTADKMNFEKGISSLEQKLKNNAIRMKVRNILPSIISRIDFNAVKGWWKVYDLNGKDIYTSMPN